MDWLWQGRSGGIDEEGRSGGTYQQGGGILSGLGWVVMLERPVYSSGGREGSGRHDVKEESIYTSTAWERA